MSPFASLFLSLALAPQQAAKERVFEPVVLEREGYPLFMDLYARRDGAAEECLGREPMLVMFHASHGSRGEYRPIAPRLAALGYTCLAVDLGVGKETRGVRNRSSYTAFGRGHKPDYLGAWEDMQAALLWAREHHPDGPVVAWGSAFSAGLVLVTAATRPDLADGALAFSPSECFSQVGQSSTWVGESLARAESPFFLAGAAGEAEVLRGFLAAGPGTAKALFVPEQGTIGGAQVLWDDSPGHEAAWAALEGFLLRHFPVPGALPPDPDEAPPGSPR